MHLYNLLCFHQRNVACTFQKAKGAVWNKSNFLFRITISANEEM
jgi:hypothetical protein